MSKFGGKMTSGGSDIEIPEEDTHVAIIFAMIDLGVQIETFQGEVSKRHKIYLGYELVESLNSKGEPFTLCGSYTYSTNKKATLVGIAEKVLRKTFSDGDDIDFDALLGKACLLDVTHSKSADGKRTYAKIKDVGGVPKQLKAPAPTRKLLIWTFDDYAGDLRAIEQANLPYLIGRRVADVIMEAENFPGKPDNDNAGSMPKNCPF